MYNPEQYSEPSEPYQEPSTPPTEVHNKLVSQERQAAPEEAPDPNFSKGDVVVVERKSRDGKPSYFEGGWVVEGIDSENGRVIIVSPDKEFEKLVRPEVLQSWQPTIELAPGTESTFQVGEIVAVPRNIKNAIGMNIPGKFRVESGWRVHEVNNDEGTVVVKSPDSKSKKTLAIDRLKGVQSMVAPMDSREALPIADAMPNMAAEAARSLVEAALSVSDRITALTKDLSDEDKLLLTSYASADESVREAQREGRGEDSTYWQQAKGQSYREMSPAAQAIAGQYTALYRKWTV